MTALGLKYFEITINLSGQLFINRQTCELCEPWWRQLHITAAKSKILFGAGRRLIIELPRTNFLPENIATYFR